MDVEVVGEQSWSPVNPYLFGGAEKQVRRTQARFIPLLANCAPVLDIGCGRGIFLRSLRTAGTLALGVDTYGPAIEACRRDGLNVEQADALSFLSTRTEQFGGIFCSHVIEHLPFDGAQRLVKACASALTEGGRLIIVTPNPGDVGVMGNTFWLDPTHVRPYPALLIESMMGEAGLHHIDSGTFHGGLPKRAMPRYLLNRAFLGPFYGKPNAYVVAAKD
jgi:2-polyprenyl-3-methyl-5-hydroxy-6-metoxy-1,4-benzoquinol methylase